mmetsp:Transcript_42579/g.46217  ORF Transcript_42579/g.46217 Transcript_42579/m.46217 type:complete len:110 (+) Transcript_42579:281-610(+)
MGCMWILVTRMRQYSRWGTVPLYCPPINCGAGTRTYNTIPKISRFQTRCFFWYYRMWILVHKISAMEIQKKMVSSTSSTSSSSSLSSLNDDNNNLMKQLIIICVPDWNG